MADVIRLRKARLTGFIPADLGAEALEARRRVQQERDRMIDLIGFAKQGAPPIAPEG